MSLSLNLEDHPLLSKFVKCVKGDDSIEFTKRELCDIAFWLRFGLSVIFGMVFGIVGITGFVGIIAYPICSSILLYYTLTLFVLKKELLNHPDCVDKFIYFLLFFSKFHIFIP